MALNLKLMNSMVKIFENKDPHSPPECNIIAALKGQSVFFQVAFKACENQTVTVKTDSPLGEAVTLKTVESIYLKLTNHEKELIRLNLEGGYEVVHNKDGRYPDYLREIKDGKVKVKKNKYRALWCEVCVSKGVPADTYPITISVTEANGEVSSVTQNVTVYDATLPEQTFLHTNWFHADCLADYYKTEAFSEKHWRICRNFVKKAIERGINVIYTCQFTPALDTAVGGERTTAQLVDVYCNDGKWSFCFDKLKRWIDMCLELGAKRIEFSHLFTQWGAEAAPKIMATVDGEYKRVFGWDTKVCDGAYPAFLSEYLPALTSKLREWGVADICIFHISDEPNGERLKTYLAAKEVVTPHLKGLYVSDAMSHIELYEAGACEHPVPRLTSALDYFGKVKDLWVYYCCYPQYETTGRFMFQTLSKVRSLGVQCFKYQLSGFLHWAYNFYNSRWSLDHIDPYGKRVHSVQEGLDCTPFPAGDSFVVYPGKGGVPEESPRLIAMYEAMCDQRALAYLSELTSYEYTNGIIEELYGKEVTFTDFPQTEYFYIHLRNKVNAEIAKALGK